MSQNTIVLPNIGTISGLSLVNSINLALDSLNTLNSGGTPPSNTSSYMLWMDTTNNLIKQRNPANNGWNIISSAIPGQVIVKSASYAAVIGDYDSTFACSGTMTFTTPPASALFNGWRCKVLNLSAGGLTVTAGSGYFYGNGIVGTGVNTFTNASFNDVTIVCDGTNFAMLSTARIHGEQLFTATGNFVAPMGVSTVWVSACGGGGGGGAAGSSSSGLNTGGGGGGGGGAFIMNAVWTVVPGTTYAITIPAGGAGGVAVANAAGGAGATGGTTTIDSTFTLPGGSGGAGGTGGGTSFGGVGGGVGSYGGQGGDGVVGAMGGAGGPTIFGSTAPMQKGNRQASGSAGFPGATGYAYGAGGSGGSGNYQATGGAAVTGGNGGLGAQGIALIQW